MSIPSNPTTPGSHSRGLVSKQGIIIAVEGNIAHVRTTLTELIPVRRDIMRAKGRLPEVGETWLLTREFGQWVFGLILVGGDKSNEVPQEDVVGLTDLLESIESDVVSQGSRLDDHDEALAYLSQYANNWASYQELTSFENVMESISLFSAVHSVAVASAGRYINFGAAVGTYPINGVRIFVSAAVGGSSIQMGLYRGPIDNMVLIDSISISSATTGMKSAPWSSAYSTTPGEHLAVGMATATVSTLAVGGFESAIITNAPKGHVAALGATTLVSTLVMGATTPHSVTQGRHWIGLY
jgi:hypothetical protein